MVGVVESAIGHAHGSMVSYEQDHAEGVVETLNHEPRLEATHYQPGAWVQFVRNEVAHPVVPIVDHDLGCASRQRPRHGSIDLGGQQMAGMAIYGARPYDKLV